MNRKRNVVWDIRHSHGPAMRKQWLRDYTCQVDFEELGVLPLPTVNTLNFRPDGCSKSKNRSGKIGSWKVQKKSRAQWARHMEGPCRCYIERGESGESLLMRLGKEGFPVSLARSM